MGRVIVTNQQTRNICIIFVQCWTNVEDVGPTLYKCYTNVLCLLGRDNIVWPGVCTHRNSLKFVIYSFIYFPSLNLSIEITRLFLAKLIYSNY